MDISTLGLTTLKSFEGSRNKAYQDSVGVWTIGVGHTSAAGPPHVVQGMTLTDAEIVTLLHTDVAKYVRAVDNALDADATQNQFDAMVCLCYNIGAGAFANSTVVRKFNQGDIQGAADAFLLWNRAGGRVLAGLTKRRTAERALFLKQTHATVTASATEAIPKPVPVEIADTCTYGFACKFFDWLKGDGSATG